MASTQKHIFVGQAKDTNIFYEAQSTNRIVNWAVPVTARFGEKGIFLLPRVLGTSPAFVTVGFISSHPLQDENRWTNWGAKIEIIVFKPAFNPIELALVQNKMSEEWPAIKFPWDRSFAIDRNIEADFINILKRQQTSLSTELQFAQAFQ